MRSLFLSRVVVATALLAFTVNTHAQSGCAEAQRALEATIRDRPETARESLANAVRLSPTCASELVTSAIVASEASDVLVAKLVESAVRASPRSAIAIAESAIAASPSSSDKVADVVQQVLGDCDSVAEDVALSLRQSPGKILVVLEDSLRAHQNCTCEIVSSVVKGANGNAQTIRQIVELSVTLVPTKAAEVSECALKAAPGSANAIQVGLDSALSDSQRGEGALAAALEPEPEMIDRKTSQETEATILPNTVSSNEPSYDTSEKPQLVKSYGKGNGEGYGKNSKRGSLAMPESSDSGSWIPWGGAAPNAAPVYLIAPSGGLIPPGDVLVPMSPSDPKIDDKDKKDDEYDEP